MADAKKLNMILVALAVAILVVSFSAFAYTLVPKGDPDIIVINGLDYDWEAIFTDFETEPFTANDVAYEGVSLEDIILDAGVEDPANHSYRLTGIDGYQKDITEWDDMRSGYLTIEDHRARFPGMTQSFWVADLATIEVI